MQGWQDAQRKQELTTPGSEPVQHQPISFDEWRSKPWKYKGYPAFSKWMASSNDFFLVRRFGSLNARVLLFMQNRVAEQEEALCAIDTRAQQSTDDQGNSGSLRNDPQQDRTQALEELVPLLKEYSKISVQFGMLWFFPDALADFHRKTSIWYHMPLSAAGHARKTIRSPT